MNERPPCDCCRTAYEFPDLTKMTYSMGCVFCGARYLSRGGQEIDKWATWGVTAKAATEALMAGDLLDPEVKRRRRK